MGNFRFRLLWTCAFVLLLLYSVESLRSETNAPAPAAAPAAPGSPAAPVNTAAQQQVRRILTAQDDPSMILEPVPTPTPTPTPSPTPTATPTPKPSPTPTPTPIPLKAKLQTDRIIEAAPTVEVAIILHNGQFFPSKIKLRDGALAKLYFATINDKPAALIIERLQIQRWIAKEDQPKPTTEIDRAKYELTRELSRNRITEIKLEPTKGSYSFHDALSGARGQITVE